MPSFGSQIDTQRIPVKGLVPESSATPPTAPVAGQLWLDTSLTPARVKVYSNNSWLMIDDLDTEHTANKGQANGYAGLNGSSQVALANLPVAADNTPSATSLVRADDTRLSNTRAPSGSAGGDLSGTYPNPTVAPLAITDAKVAAANKDGVAGTASMRTLGSGAQQAMAGNTRLDQITAPTAAVSLNSQKITNLADPTNPTDAANKNYVDSARAGLRLKDAVRVATTANITLTGTQTIDGVSVIVGDRVLVKAQTTPSANGIYVVAAGAWTRATDADSAAEVSDGATTFVQQGGQADTTWAQINTITTLGTDSQSWVQQGAAASYNAGAGLTQNGSTFDVVAADGSITVAADSITVGNVPITKGGTGATTAPAARTNLGATGKYAADLGALTAGSETTITHGLATTDVTAVFRRNATGANEFIDWRVIDANTIGVTAGIAYSASALRAVVVG